jgi:peptide/nickel transport system substrate-binding protein
MRPAPTVDRNEAATVAARCRPFRRPSHEHREDNMVKQYLRCLAVVSLLLALSAGDPACAQKSGGILRIASPANPANMSILEAATIIAEMPMMGVFNNLIVFDQHKQQVSLDTIVSDLATSWSWNEDDTALTFQLRQEVKWHDGKPFTAADVKCTWDLLLDKQPDKLRLNPRKTGYDNLTDVATNGDYEVTFKLKRPQPAFPMLLAGGFSPIYPCHVTATQMRQHPIGSGPFKFVEFKPNERIKVTRNPDYWKKDRPYLDGIEYTIIQDPSTADLAFVAGKFDMTFPFELSVPRYKNMHEQVPDAMCVLSPGTVNTHLLINRVQPPFDNPDLRRAMALTIDRKAYIDTLGQGEGEIGGVLQPPPAGLWGMPPEQIAELPGYGLDVQKNREEARALARKLGYGPDNRLKIKVTTRDWSVYRDPAVLLIDQLKQIYIDGELELVDTPQYFPKIQRKDYTVALNLQTAGPDPDPTVQAFYGCGSNLNWDNYCNLEMDKMIEAQSREGDAAKRKKILWTIERKLANDNVRPIIFYRRGGTCERPYVKGLTIMVNSIFNSWRMEDVWLDK